MEEDLMSRTRQATGSCVCGAVTLTLPAMTSSIGDLSLQHLPKMDGWTDAGAVDGADDVRFEGEGNIATFESTPWEERGFCSKYGSG
jgi:hypothetical protein